MSQKYLFENIFHLHHVCVQPNLWKTLAQQLAVGFDRESMDNSSNVGWAPKNRCFWTLVLEKTLESLLYSKEIKPVIPKGNQPWISIGRTWAEAEAPVRWPPYMKSRLIGKDPDASKDWGHKEKEMTENEVFR